MTNKSYHTWPAIHVYGASFRLAIGGANLNSEESYSLLK